MICKKAVSREWCKVSSTRAFNDLYSTHPILCIHNVTVVHALYCFAMFHDYYVDVCFFSFCVRCEPEILNQRINGPVNAHLISGPSISIKHTKPD